MDELDVRRALPHCRRDALDGCVANIAGGEDTGKARLKQHRCSLERPAARPVTVAIQIGPREDETSLVTVDDAVQPLRMRLGADHDEESGGWDSFDRPARPVADDDRSELFVAFALDHFGTKAN